MTKKKGQYILAHDLGTTGDKAVLYAEDGTQVASASHAYTTRYPKPGYAEQNADDWWNAVCTTTRELLEKAGIAPNSVAAVGFSAQMMGCLPVDRDGAALRPAIIWADLRSGREAVELERRLGMDRVYDITGHRVSSSYTATKLAWVKRHEGEIYARTYKTLQTKEYVIHKLTGRFVTDYSDACGTNLFDLRGKVWSSEIADALELEPDKLPDPFPSVHVAGRVHAEAARATGLAEGTPVVLGGGDGVCAATGATITEPGGMYVVIGTSAWIAGASHEPVFDPEKRTFNWVHMDGKLYSPCGTMQSAGFSYAWIRNVLGAVLPQHGVGASRDTLTELDRTLDDLVKESPPGARSLVYLPYLMGERSPRWNPDAKAAFIGLTATHTAGDLTRSVLEGVAYNLNVILSVFRNDAPAHEVIAIGGGAANETWLQILADVWNVEILVPQQLEDATSMGAAICAGVAVGVYPDFSVARSFNPVERRITPRQEHGSTYRRMIEIFDESYQALTDVFGKLSEPAE